MKTNFKTRTTVIQRNQTRFRVSKNRNEVKANYVERLIKTLKLRIVKMFQHQNSFQYLKKLDDIVQNYNGTYHSNFQPRQVTKQNELSVFEEQYIEPLLRKELDRQTKKTIVKKEGTKTIVKREGKKTIVKKGRKRNKFRFKVGGQVRISHLRQLFDREYDQKWTGEVFTVTKRWLREGIPVYELKDYGNDPVKGTFYQPELQPVVLNPDESFKVDKVLKTRGRGRNKEHLVSWLNWPSKYNSWVKDADMQDLM